MHLGPWSDILLSMKYFHKKKKGFSLVEVLIGSAIVSASIIYITNSYANFVALSTTNTARIQAAFLLDEGIEALKTMRGESWSQNIASTTASTTYHLVWSTNKWKATTTPQLINNVFTRTMVFGPVYRDGNFNIAQSGTLDPGSKKVDFTVSWSDKGATTTKGITIYVFNIYNN